ncbi:uncharacterized protein MELLADRAFT_85218 [Melampsora larici-populina 98AG31]|uniref:AP complex mu/sigma subunit domain-containing protein n=1 Tax=Melampsora larici-populina (strain 98AG31 / pathotype 3-4-7) TaxID=747676 RepID=F4RHY9_MELLP|nr:uncharacterized protein MELLADRAFT_85218 [Melampsora larici-populina 98AG31]EGG07905.1 hypothetical protein MELLADRAFT_85218 [Melampsora larici-populina 98AG31]
MKYILPLRERLTTREVYRTRFAGSAVVASCETSLPAPTQISKHLNPFICSLKKVYLLLDEMFLAGEIVETSELVILESLEYLDKFNVVF